MQTKFKASEHFNQDEVKRIKLICNIFDVEYVFIDEIKYAAPKNECLREKKKSF